jgi:hypothetical protein
MTTTFPPPAVGAPIFVRLEPETNNGSDLAPGIITRVWEHGHDAGGRERYLVNYRIFEDGNNVSWITSGQYYKDAETANDAYDGNDAPARFACWPPDAADTAPPVPATPEPSAPPPSAS